MCSGLLIGLLDLCEESGLDHDVVNLILLKMKQHILSLGLKCAEREEGKYTAQFKAWCVLTTNEQP